jgi:acyl dehydratase
MPDALLHYEDFTVGRSFALGPYDVTAEEIIAFAREFDPQPQHLSEEGGRESILGGLAASGFHVCGMAMRMLVDAVFSKSDILGGIGADDIRWLKPVRPGDVLTGTVRVEEARLSSKDITRGYVTTRLDILRGEAKGEPEKVLTLTNVVIMGTRSKTGEPETGKTS